MFCFSVFEVRPCRHYKENTLKKKERKKNDVFGWWVGIFLAYCEKPHFILRVRGGGVPSPVITCPPLK